MADHERDLADAVEELAAALEAVEAALEESRRRTSGAPAGRTERDVDDPTGGYSGLRTLLEEARAIREEVDDQLAAASSSSGRGDETAAETHTIDVRFGSDEEPAASGGDPEESGERSERTDEDLGGAGNGDETDDEPVEIDVDRELEAIRRDVAEPREDGDDRDRESDDGSNDP